MSCSQTLVRYLTAVGHRLRGNRRGNRRDGSTFRPVVAVLVVMVVSLIGAAVYFSTSAEVGEDLLMAEVTLGTFEHIIREQGEVDSSNNVEYKCLVKSRISEGGQGGEGRGGGGGGRGGGGRGGGGGGRGGPGGGGQPVGLVEILWVVAEGTMVKPGDELVRFDSSAYEQELDLQEIMCNTSLALTVQTANNYAAALIAKTEYVEGTFKQEEQTILSEIFVAEEGLRRTELLVRSSERLAAKGLVPALQLEADRFAVEKARNALALARGKLIALREYTQAKMLTYLDSDIETARAMKDSQEHSHLLELKKLADLKEMIEKCLIRAEHSGQVVHANRYSSRGGSSEFVVEEGATVREGQVVIRIPDPLHMQVKVSINESRVTLVQEGMPAEVIIDALSDEPFAGRVANVKEYAEPTSFFGSGINQYAVLIEIINPPPEIRPGLTAEVGILIAYDEQATQIPVRAVCEYKGHTFSLVKSGDRWDTREITIGSSNDSMVTILSGLEEGEQVVMNPRRHTDKLQLPDLPDETHEWVAVDVGVDPTDGPDRR